MNKNIFAIVSGAVLAVGILGGSCTALAEGPLTGAIGKLEKVNETTHLESNLTSSVGTIIKTILSLVGTIFFALTIYAGILWMTAMGNGEQVERSRSIVTAAVIGLAITLSAYAITYFVGNRLNTVSKPSSVTTPASP